MSKNLTSVEIGNNIIRSSRFVPDYSRSEDLTLNQVFVAPEDGYIFCYAHTLSSLAEAEVSLRLVDENNSTLFTFCNRNLVDSGGTNAMATLCLPVGKGDRFILNSFVYSQSDSFKKFFYFK